MSTPRRPGDAFGPMVTLPNFNDYPYRHQFRILRARPISPNYYGYDLQVQIEGDYVAACHAIERLDSRSIDYPPLPPTVVIDPDAKWAIEQKRARDLLRGTNRRIEGELQEARTARKVAEASLDLARQRMRALELALQCRLPERSKAFPVEASRFSYLEIDESLRVPAPPPLTLAARNRPGVAVPCCGSCGAPLAVDRRGRTRCWTCEPPTRVDLLEVD